jgi:cell filamentation protein
LAHYTYQGTDTLKNKFGQGDHDKLEKIEGRLVAARLYQFTLGHGPIGDFDAEHLKAIHRHLFQDLYEWAGRTRGEGVRLSDGTVATEPVMHKPGGKDFLAGQSIPGALDDLANGLRRADRLRGLSRADFAVRAADIMAGLNAIHPFRDGNGRTQRVFVSELAQQAGHRLDFTVVSRERMIAASIAANEHDDPTMMRRLFNEISDTARVAALRRAIDFLEQQHFPWNDRYVATTEPGHEVELTLAGVAGAHFMGRTNSQILVGKTVDLPAPHPLRHETFTIVPS